MDYDSFQVALPCCSRLFLYCRTHVVVPSFITKAAHQQQNHIFAEEEGKVNVSSIAPITQNPPPPSLKYLLATFVIPVAKETLLQRMAFLVPFLVTYGLTLHLVSIYRMLNVETNDY